MIELIILINSIPNSSLNIIIITIIIIIIIIINSNLSCYKNQFFLNRLKQT